MLRVILIAAPSSDRVEAVATALDHIELTAVYAAPEFTNVADSIAQGCRLAAETYSRFEVGESALDFIVDLADRGEATIALVAAVEVVRALVLHALDAPVPVERLALDAGAIAEIEVRTDAPWTVNRINDGCHLVA